jgi:hypothetical protein
MGSPGGVVSVAPCRPPAGLHGTATDPHLLDAWRRDAGEPAGLGELLADLDRTARPTTLRRTRAETAFRWDPADAADRGWMPQGITTSGDAGADGLVHGREVVVTSWYRHTSPRSHQAARVTVVDVTDPGSPRYRHVLLVEPAHGLHGPRTRAVLVHAGGLVWHGDLLYVAATYGGMRVFHLADLTRADPPFHGFGYLLPQRLAYRPLPGDRHRLRFSFLSLDRTSSPPSLLAGEYSPGDDRSRIARFRLDPVSGRLQASDSLVPAPTAFDLDVPRMQGVACADGTYFVSTSGGRLGRGDLWTGSPEQGFRRRALALPVGPEDLSVNPARRLLWSLSEYPRRRAVFALRTDDWAGPPRPG